ncbi:hypothetical protein MMC25_003208 [Agyrium rufum]|nr:hypothetical protein [Agyrium rufum]
MDETADSTDSDREIPTLDFSGSDQETFSPTIAPVVNLFTLPTSARDATPQDLFVEGRSPEVYSFRQSRTVRRSNPREMLIYTDGCCLNNGQPDARGAWAFVLHDSPGTGGPDVISAKLEQRGPTGVKHPQTSNRAELRAVIAALQYRWYAGEAFERIVIATDSVYVVDGITKWMPRWFTNGWVTREGHAVKNQDLWKLLAKLITDSRNIAIFGPKGADVVFWRIPRALNTKADAAAKAAAASGESPEEFTEMMGLSF